MNSTLYPTKPATKPRSVRVLKDFLRDDSNDSTTTTTTTTSTNPPPAPASLPRSRSRSRAAAEAAISSFQKLHRLLTNLRGSNKSKSTYSCEGKVVKVKDILRWKSFRDQDKSLVPSKSPKTAMTLTTLTTNDEEGEFSFTAEELPWWLVKGENWDNEVDVLEARDLLRETTETEDGPLPQVVPQEDNITSEEEKEQHSPVSVLNSPFRDEVSDEECSSSFDQSLANVERTKQRLFESIQWLESLAGIDEQSSLDDDLEAQDQEDGDGEGEEEDVNEDNRSEAKSRVYMFKVLSRLSRGGHGVKGIEGCFIEMDRQGQWDKFGEQREEVGEELEAWLLHDLVDELLLDLFG